ncbi:hypothetical protein CXB51_034125 [Gossypium anomalum]|uniref:Uncharacterized protein n=1 Tax=Gossypium anomalum TaxID=47600 RepID=A0A8J6CGH1_9ROSI|nr:hypothetical protein CXB51_034125 [Gossypium anomalum]
MDVPKSKSLRGRGPQEICTIFSRDGTILPCDRHRDVVKAESFIEFGLRKDKFESSKPKEKSNCGGNHEEDGNENGGNSKNDSNGKPPNGKWKPINRLKGLVKCFFCDGLHMVKDCLKKSALFAIEGDDESDRASMRLGLIVCFVEAKRVERMRRS